MRPYPGLEVDHQHSDIEPTLQAAIYLDQGPQFYEPYLRNKSNEAINTKIRAVAPLDRRVCGLRRTTFAILVAAAVVIIAAAALGGGLGGGLSRNKTATASSQLALTFSTSSSLTSEPVSSTSTTSASASTASSDSNLIVTAEVGTVSGTPVTLYRDCPSSNDSLYSVQYSSTTYEFRKLCNTVFVVSSSVQNANWVNQPTSSLNDCINLCTGWNENNVTKGNADKVCSAVCWRYGFEDDDLPGQCFGYTSNNASSGGFSAQMDDLCDAAAWINQT